jgi:hypothetical protein
MGFDQDSDTGGQVRFSSDSGTPHYHLVIWSGGTGSSAIVAGCCSII